MVSFSEINQFNTLILPTNSSQNSNNTGPSQSSSNIEPIQVSSQNCVNTNNSSLDTKSLIILYELNDQIKLLYLDATLSLDFSRIITRFLKLFYPDSLVKYIISTQLSYRFIARFLTPSGYLKEQFENPNDFLDILESFKTKFEQLECLYNPHELLQLARFGLTLIKTNQNLNSYTQSPVKKLNSTEKEFQPISYNNKLAPFENLKSESVTEKEIQPISDNNKLVLSEDLNLNIFHVMYNMNTSLALVLSQKEIFAAIDENPKSENTNFGFFTRIMEFFPEIKYINQITTKHHALLYDILNNKYFDNLTDAANHFESYYRKNPTLNSQLHRPTYDTVKRFIIDQYELSDNIIHKYKFTAFYQELQLKMGFSPEYNDFVRNILPQVLKDLKLQKKRYSDGMYWYGLLAKPYSPKKTIFEQPKSDNMNEQPKSDNMNEQLTDRGISKMDYISSYINQYSNGLSTKTYFPKNPIIEQPKSDNMKEQLPNRGIYKMIYNSSYTNQYSIQLKSKTRKQSKTMFNPYVIEQRLNKNDLQTLNPQMKLKTQLPENQIIEATSFSNQTDTNLEVPIGEPSLFPVQLNLTGESKSLTGLESNSSKTNSVSLCDITKTIENDLPFCTSSDQELECSEIDSIFDGQISFI